MSKRGAARRFGRLPRVALLQLAIAGAVLGVIELGLRFGLGAPYGLFLGWFPGRAGLYPENSEIPMPGAVPWLVKTNRWGFRGEDVALSPTPGITRIAMLGDSVTDGFFVNNEDTYPAQTEARLQTRGASAEVINAACGGASIDAELAILRHMVARFKPGIVILTFVTNDLDALASLDDEQLFRKSLAERSAARGLLRSIVVNTALGEWLLDSYLRFRSAAYNRSVLAASTPTNSDPLRYRIPNGGDFQRNSRIFMERFKDSDGALLAQELPAEARRLLERYLKAWDLFIAESRRQGGRPVFVYFPAYPQIYDDNPQLNLRDRLREHSEANGVPFLDLTPALRSQAGAVLHLAPVDFHLNPEGNRVIGFALGDFLIEQGLVETRRSSAGARP
jgi:lysophospholipase L1-like esterase